MRNSPRKTATAVASSLGVLALAATLWGGTAAYAATSLTADDDTTLQQESTSESTPQEAPPAEQPASPSSVPEPDSVVAEDNSNANSGDDQSQDDATEESNETDSTEQETTFAPSSNRLNVQGGKPDGDRALICPDITDGLGYEAKVDTTGDPATVSYTAPDGYLVDAYCVKAGTEPIIVQVDPPSATVVIDHPNKDSVSHYQVHLVLAPDDPDPVIKESMGQFIYQLLNPNLPPSWENSGLQYFCQDADGHEWFSSVDLANCELPDDLVVCGTGWGVQEDGAKDWAYDGPFVWPTNIQYPVDNIGWPPLYKARHYLLSDVVTVPDCEPVVEEPEVATSLDCKIVDGDNTFFTITNPNDTPITVSLTLGAVTQDVDVPANDSTVVPFHLDEDQTIHVKVVFNGDTVYEADIVRDCEATVAKGYTKITHTKGCGWIEFTFSHTAEIGEDEVAPEPVTFVYSDKDGTLVELPAMEANAEPKTVRVDYAEDAGGGTVTAFAGVKGEEPTQYEVDTNCKPAGGGFNGEVIGDAMANWSPLWVGIGIASAAAFLVILFVGRGRKAVGPAVVQDAAE